MQVGPWVISCITLPTQAFFFFHAWVHWRKDKLRTNKHGCVDLSRPQARMFAFRILVLFLGLLVTIGISIRRIPPFASSLHYYTPLAKCLQPCSIPELYCLLRDESSYCCYHSEPPAETPHIP
eukprot:g38402.t1